MLVCISEKGTIFKHKLQGSKKFSDSTQEIEKN